MLVTKEAEAQSLVVNPRSCSYMIIIIEGL